ncbi:MAG: hypothetical protein ACI8QZ_000272 [Chlamydiales bacterium]|jgi:hypothetical protein
MESLKDIAGSWGDSLLAQADLPRVLTNLVLTLLVAQVLAWHYVRFAQVLSNKRKFARSFVFIAGTTLLVITIVSASLALSLGLVGALSIVRFRTPIKEPEELAYLYLTIATGIGMGANEPVLTLTVVAGILIYLTFQNGFSGSKASLRTVLHFTTPAEAPSEGGDQKSLPELLSIAEAACARVDLRRVDTAEDEFHASLLVELDSSQRLAQLLDQLRGRFPKATVSVIERDAHE